MQHHVESETATFAEMRERKLLSDWDVIKLPK